MTLQSPDTLASQLLDAVNRKDTALLAQRCDAARDDPGFREATQLALNQALIQNNEEAALLLLRRGGKFLFGGFISIGNASTSEPIIRALLEHGMPATYRDAGGKSLIYWCAGLSAGLLRELAAGDADIHSRDREASMDALGVAAMHWKTDNIAVLLELGCKPNPVGPAQFTPLHHLCDASYEGRGGDFVSALDLLLANGVAVDGRSATLRTPLMHAAEQGNGLALEALIARGADLEARDSDGLTALQLAAYSCNGPAINALLACGADARVRTAEGQTVLHLLGCELETLRPAQGELESALRALVAHGAELQARDGHGQTALMVAIKRAEPDTCRVLLAAGIDYCAPDAAGVTPLQKLDAMIAVHARGQALQDVKGMLLAQQAREDLNASLQQLLAAGRSPNR